VEQVGAELGAIYGNSDELLKHARVVTFEETEDNEFNINVPRYVSTFARKQIKSVPTALEQVRLAKEVVESGFVVIERTLSEIRHEET
jgi:type I restriction enzyme M protein